MKRYLSIILTFVMIISGMDVYPAAARITSGQNEYKDSYGSQLVDENDNGLSLRIYNQMVENYIYQNGDLDNPDGKYTGLAKPLTGDGSIYFEAAGSKTFESKDELEHCVWEEAPEVQAIFRAGLAAFDAFAKDYPQAYWLGEIQWRLNIKGTEYGDGRVETGINATLIPKEYEEGMSEFIRQFDDAVCEAEKSISSQKKITSDTKPEKIVKYLHDYVAEQVDYNFEVTNNPNSEMAGYAHTPLPVLLNDKAWGNKVVCEGYAKAFKILCDRFGVKSALIIGQSLNNNNEFENHMWNAVEINGKWYGVDVTWDDQTDQIYDKYLLVGNSSKGFYDIFEKDHIPSNQFSSYVSSKEFILPQISDKRFVSDEEGGTTPNGSNPVKPGEPTTPDGSNPVKPGEPTTPDESGSVKPGEPTTPDESGSVKPGEPTTPDGSNPVKPGEPTTPDGSNPVKPGEPTTPDGSNSVKPGEPTTPDGSNPANPGEPTTPDDSKPVNLGEATTPNGSNSVNSGDTAKILTDGSKVFVSKTKVKKVTKKLASKKAKISLKKISGAKYEVKISTTKKFKKKNTVTKNVKKAVFTINSKKIKGKKVLYVKARAYKLVNKKTYYGKWSKIKKIKIKR